MFSAAMVAAAMVGKEGWVEDEDEDKPFEEDGEDGDREVGNRRVFSRQVNERLEEYYVAADGVKPSETALEEMGRAVSKTALQVHSWWYRRRKKGAEEGADPPADSLAAAVGRVKRQNSRLRSKSFNFPTRVATVDNGERSPSSSMATPLQLGTGRGREGGGEQPFEVAQLKVRHIGRACENMARAAAEAFAANEKLGIDAISAIVSKEFNEFGDRLQEVFQRPPADGPGPLGADLAVPSPVLPPAMQPLQAGGSAHWLVPTAPPGFGEGGVKDEEGLRATPSEADEAALSLSMVVKEEEGEEAGNRRVFSRSVNERLEEYYRCNRGVRPSEEQLHEIAQTVNKTVIQVHSWWYRRRNQDRKVMLDIEDTGEKSAKDRLRQTKSFNMGSSRLQSKSFSVPKSRLKSASFSVRKPSKSLVSKRSSEDGKPSAAESNKRARFAGPSTSAGRGMPDLLRSESFELSQLKVRHIGRATEAVMKAIRAPPKAGELSFETLTSLHSTAFNEYTTQLQLFCWRCWADTATTLVQTDSNDAPSEEEEVGASAKGPAARKKRAPACSRGKQALARAQSSTIRVAVSEGGSSGMSKEEDNPLAGMGPFAPDAGTFPFQVMDGARGTSLPASNPILTTSERSPTNLFGDIDEDVDPFAIPPLAASSLVPSAEPAPQFPAPAGLDPGILVGSPALAQALQLQGLLSTTLGSSPLPARYEHAVEALRASQVQAEAAGHGALEELGAPRPAVDQQGALLQALSGPHRAALLAALLTPAPRDPFPQI